MSAVANRLFARLASRYGTDGGPLASRGLWELAAFCSTFPSAAMGPVINDGWPTVIRKTLGATATLLAMWPAVCLPPGTRRVDARVRAKLDVGGVAATMTVSVRPALFLGTIAPAASASVSVTSATYAYYNFTIDDLTVLSQRHPWTQDLYVVLRAQMDSGADDLLVSNFALWPYSADNLELIFP